MACRRAPPSARARAADHAAHGSMTRCRSYVRSRPRADHLQDQLCSSYTVSLFHPVAARLRFRELKHRGIVRPAYIAQPQALDARQPSGWLIRGYSINRLCRNYRKFRKLISVSNLRYCRHFRHGHFVIWKCRRHGAKNCPEAAEAGCHFHQHIPRRQLSNW